MEEFSSLTSTEGALDLTSGPKIKSVTVIWKTTRGNSVLENEQTQDLSSHPVVCFLCYVYLGLYFIEIKCVFKFVILCKILVNIDIYKNQTSSVS